MVVLSLDPSSTIIGYAVMDDGQLRDAGPITPDQRGGPSYQRVRDLSRYLRQVMDVCRPGVILIEWTKGKVGKRHQGRGAGLAVYGTGVGAALTTADIWAEERPGVLVFPILENDWTRGITKEKRSQVIAQQYPQYQPGEDPGGDVADAIGLANWWIRQSLFARSGKISS